MAEKEEDIRVKNLTVLLIWFFCRDLPFTIKLALLVFNKKICLKAKVKFGEKFVQTNSVQVCRLLSTPVLFTTGYIRVENKKGRYSFTSLWGGEGGGGVRSILTGYQQGRGDVDAMHLALFAGTSSTSVPGSLWERVCYILTVKLHVI